MNKLAEKIKNIFKRRERLEAIKSKKDKLLRDTIWGASDIARSIRESSKFQTQKNLWRRIFYF